MHGLVLIDKLGNLLYNSIIWCDGRASKGASKALDTSSKRLKNLKPFLKGGISWYGGTSLRYNCRSIKKRI